MHAVRDLKKAKVGEDGIPLVDFGHIPPLSLSLSIDDDRSLHTSSQVLIDRSSKGASAHELPALPIYDRSPATRLFCISGLILSWAIGIACIALGPWSFTSVQAYLTQSGGYNLDSGGTHTFLLGSAGQAVVKLAVNICITIGTDCLAHIHAVSLRWALWREGRLRYNSHIRLLDSTRICSANRWSTNLVSAIFLAACYASSGQLFLASTQGMKNDFVLNGVAVITLGIGILGQAIISSLCLVKSSALIPTWSSNPMNTTLVAMHLGLKPSKDRPTSSNDLTKVASPQLTHQTPLRLRQRSLQEMESRVLTIVVYLWALFITFLIWAGITCILCHGQSHKALALYSSLQTSDLQQHLCALLITIAFQGVLTLGLHATELIVHADFDEILWQRVGTASGAQYSMGFLASGIATVSSWPNMVLFLLKPVAHWVFGLSVSEANDSLSVNWQGLFYLSAVVMLLAVFATHLVRWRPKGDVPATFGHLQSIADLVVEWPERMTDPITWKLEPTNLTSAES